MLNKLWIKKIALALCLVMASTSMQAGMWDYITSAYAASIKYLGSWVGWKPAEKKVNLEEISKEIAQGMLKKFVDEYWALRKRITDQAADVETFLRATTYSQQDQKEIKELLAEEPVLVQDFAQFKHDFDGLRNIESLKVVIEKEKLIDGFNTLTATKDEYIKNVKLLRAKMMAKLEEKPQVPTKPVGEVAKTVVLVPQIQPTTTEKKEHEVQQPTTRVPEKHPTTPVVVEPFGVEFLAGKKPTVSVKATQATKPIEAVVEAVAIEKAEEPTVESKRKQAAKDILRLFNEEKQSSIQQFPIQKPQTSTEVKTTMPTIAEVPVAVTPIVTEKQEEPKKLKKPESLEDQLRNKIQEQYYLAIYAGGNYFPQEEGYTAYAGFVNNLEKLFKENKKKLDEKISQDGVVLNKELTAMVKKADELMQEIPEHLEKDILTLKLAYRSLGSRSDFKTTAKFLEQELEKIYAAVQQNRQQASENRKKQAEEKHKSLAREYEQPMKQLKAKKPERADETVSLQQQLGSSSLRKSQERPKKTTVTELPKVLEEKKKEKTAIEEIMSKVLSTMEQLQKEKESQELMAKYERELKERGKQYLPQVTKQVDEWLITLTNNTEKIKNRLKEVATEITKNRTKEILKVGEQIVQRKIDELIYLKEGWSFLEGRLNPNFVFLAKDTLKRNNALTKKDKDQNMDPYQYYEFIGLTSKGRNDYKQKTIKEKYEQEAENINDMQEGPEKTQQWINWRQVGYYLRTPQGVKEYNALLTAHEMDRDKALVDLMILGDKKQIDRMENAKTELILNLKAEAEDLKRGLIKQQSEKK